MNKYFFLPFLLVFSLLTNAQIREELSAPTRIHIPEDTIFRFIPESDDTLELPFIDDFADLSPRPNPARWADSSVFINNTYGRGMISMGVATFDGLDAMGRPYHRDTTASVIPTDTLTSRHINLQGRNNVYISFYYQEGGEGELPSFNDSIRLEFWSPTESTWNRVWGVTGGNGVTPFKPVILPVDSIIWLQRGFRFRFCSFGNPAGAFDVWNLDYVILGASRTPDDSIVREVGFVAQHPSILTNNFEAIPWWTYNEQFYNRESVPLRYRRNVPEGTINLILGQYRIDEGTPGTVFGTGNGNINLDNGHISYVETEFTQPISNFTLPFTPQDEFSFRIRSFFSGANEGLRQSDTVRRIQHFGNYYAYDDGSAERAYGIDNQPGGISMASFQLLANDSLQGMYIYFQPAGVDARQNAFQIVVYENNNGIPGDLLYESDSMYQPIYSERLQYVPFQLEDPVMLPSGTYFIGTKQRDQAKLNVGFDRNNIGKNTLIYGDGDTWYPTIFDGTLMIRPYFRYPARELSRKPDFKERAEGWKVYPNPTNRLIYIDGLDSRIHYTLRNALGQTVQSAFLEPGENIDLHGLSPGMYMLFGGKNNENAFRAKIILKP